MKATVLDAANGRTLTLYPCRYVELAKPFDPPFPFYTLGDDRFGETQRTSLFRASDTFNYYSSIQYAAARMMSRTETMGTGFPTSPNPRVVFDISNHATLRFERGELDTPLEDSRRVEVPMPPLTSSEADMFAKRMVPTLTRVVDGYSRDDITLDAIAALTEFVLAVRALDLDESVRRITVLSHEVLIPRIRAMVREGGTDDYLRKVVDNAIVAFQYRARRRKRGEVTFDRDALFECARKLRGGEKW